MNIQEDLTCKYCNCIYTDPVSLICCGENVCKKHIDEIFSKKSTQSLKCPLCNSDLPNQTFQINKSLKNLLEREIHKFKIDPESENLIIKFKQTIQNIESINNDPENLIHEKISELKRQVDLDREKINVLADSVIKKLDSYENELKKDCKTSSNLDYYGQLVDKMKTQLNEYEKYFKSLNNTAEDTKKKNKEIHDSIANLENGIKEYEKKLFKNKCINYEPMKDNVDNFFGKISVSPFQNSDSKGITLGQLMGLSYNASATAMIPSQNETGSWDNHFFDDMGINENSTQVLNIPGQEPFSVSMLVAALPQEQKQMLGERLYPLVQSLHPEWAAKITGMLLEIDNGEILHMLSSSEALKAKVDEAVYVLQDHIKKKSNRKK